MNTITSTLNSVARQLIGLSSRDAAVRAEVHHLFELLLAVTRAPTEEEESEVAPALIPNSLVEHCELKAEGARWTAARQRLLSRGTNFSDDIAPLDREIIERAKEAECFLWMNHPSFSPPADLALLDTLGGCFEATGAALEVVREIFGCLDDDRGNLQQLLLLVAEAQSALLSAIENIGGPTDKEQLAVFVWLKEQAERLGIYIDRHMKADNLADPTQWPSLLNRLHSFRDAAQRRIEQDEQKGRLVGDLDGLVSRIDDADDNGGAALWNEIGLLLDELVDLGVPPSSVEIRDLLLPHIDDAPELADRPGYALVVREINRFLASSDETPPEEAPSAPIPQLAAAAELLQGRSLLLIGGDNRPHSKAALESAFQLSELVWLSTKHGTSVTSFEPYVARTDIAAVLLAIRWASHGFGEVRRYCTRYGKPLVRLPAGYSPEQVASQILAQCSDRLGQPDERRDRSTSSASRNSVGDT